MLNYGRRAMIGALCLMSTQLVACAGMQQYTPWSQSGQPASEASGAPSALATPAPSTAALAASSGAVPTNIQQKRASQTAQRLAAERAARASANAMKASKQAAIASKEAAGAVAALQPGSAQGGAASSKSGGNAGAAATPGAPVITLGDAAPSSVGDAPSSVGDSSASAAGVTVAPAEDDTHLRADRMIHEVNDEAKKVDSRNLDGDEKRRETIALRLLKSAETAYGAQDYSAAYSLALKASILLKPLPQTTSSASRAH
jgi:hypothetical protein